MTTIFKLGNKILSWIDFVHASMILLCAIALVIEFIIIEPVRLIYHRLSLDENIKCLVFFWIIIILAVRKMIVQVLYTYPAFDKESYVNNLDLIGHSPRLKHGLKAFAYLILTYLGLGKFNNIPLNGLFKISSIKFGNQFKIHVKKMLKHRKK